MFPYCRPSWLFVLALVAAGPAISKECCNWTTEAGGSLKSITAYQKLRQQGYLPNDYSLFLEERARVHASLSTSQWRLELADETSFFLNNANSPLVPVPAYEPKDAVNTRRTWAKSNNVRWINRVDRASLRFREGDWETQIGKQVVPTGVGHIFQAVSQVPRQPFVVIDPEYPITEDALVVSWNGPFTIEARYLPRVDGQAKDNFHLRTKGSSDGIDLAMTAGRSDDKNYLGLETAGNLGDSLIRGELVGYDKNGAGFAQAMLGWDYAYSSQWRNEWEVFYNGFNGVAHRSAPYSGKLYLGTNVVFDPSPEWKVSLLSTINLSDRSALVHMSVNYSISADLDLLGGYYLGIASRPDSEFGGLTPTFPGQAIGLPDTAYVLLKWHF